MTTRRWSDLINIRVKTTGHDLKAELHADQLRQLFMTTRRWSDLINIRVETTGHDLKAEVHADQLRQLLCHLDLDLRKRLCSDHRAHDQVPDPTKEHLAPDQPVDSEGTPWTISDLHPHTGLTVLLENSDRNRQP